VLHVPIQSQSHHYLLFLAEGVWLLKSHTLQHPRLRLPRLGKDQNGLGNWEEEKVRRIRSRRGNPKGTSARTMRLVSALVQRGHDV